MCEVTLHLNSKAKLKWSRTKTSLLLLHINFSYKI